MEIMRDYGNGRHGRSAELLGRRWQTAGRAACRLFVAGLLALATLSGLANAAVVRVDLGIYGGRATDLDAFVDKNNDTRVIAAVQGDAGGFVLNGARTRWEPIFFGRPGEMQAIEVDRVPGGVAENYTFGLLWDGRVIFNDSAVLTGVWDPAYWRLTPDVATIAAEFGTTLLGHSSGIYLGTASGNIYRSRNGGGTWTLIATPSAGNAVRSIAAYVDSATDPSLWVVIDNAGTPELLPLTYSGSYATGAAITVGGSSGVFERVFVYPDTSIADAPLLFVTGNSPSRSVYRGETGGSLWTTVTRPQGYFQHMAFDSTNARIYAASAVSTDLGASFTTMPNYLRTLGTIHANDGTMVINPQDLDQVFYASDWFVEDYTIASGVWTANGELATNQRVTAILIDDMHQIMDTSSTKDTFIIGGKAGVGITKDFVSRPGPFPTWTFPIYPADDGAPISATRLQDYDGDGTVMENVFVGNNSGRLYRSTTEGLTAAAYTRVFDPYVDAVGYYEDPDRIEIRDIVEDPGSLDDMYFGFGDWDEGRVGGGVACSTDNGVTWSIDPSWTALADPMKVNALQVTNTKLWIGVGKDDDADPNHRGLYAKTGSLSGCGSGIFNKVTTGTILDSAVVHDLGGPTTSPTYVASSAGLFRGELSSGVWTWTDMSAALGLPTSPGWKAVTYNPVPGGGCNEEFYGAVGDQVFRLRECGGVWNAVLVSPTPFENVEVMLWDELVVGTSGGLYSMGHAAKDVTKCRASVRAARDKYLWTAMKANLGCYERAAGQGGSCPDATVDSVVARSLSRLDLGRKCDDETVSALADTWPGHCRGAATVESLEECMVADVDTLVDETLQGYFGPAGAAHATGNGVCEETLGGSFSKVFKVALKAVSKCEKLIESDTETSCPNAQTEASIQKLAFKSFKKLERRCSDADAAALQARGLPDACSGVSTVADLHGCLVESFQATMESLLAPAESSF
jgi:hypothetical protein